MGGVYSGLKGRLTKCHLSVVTSMIVATKSWTKSACCIVLYKNLKACSEDQPLDHNEPFGAISWELQE